MSNAQEFRSALEDAIQECRRIGYRPTRFMHEIQRRDPFDVVRGLVNRADHSDGFTTLWENRRLDLTVEAMILKPKWRSYFTADELKRARKRLADVHYHAPWDDGVAGTPEKSAAGDPVHEVVPPPTPRGDVIIPPVPGAEAMLARIAQLSGLPERNHEDAVKDLLLVLGFEPTSIVFQLGRIDLSIRDVSDRVLAVFEVKRSLASNSERSSARRQAMDYACQTGAPILIISDGDRYEIYDRRRGLEFDAMFCGAFQLSAFTASDNDAFSLLRPDWIKRVSD